jgi:hypothetical protein
MEILKQNYVSWFSSDLFLVIFNYTFSASCVASNGKYYIKRCLKWEFRLEVPVYFLKAKQGYTARKMEKDKWS